MQHLSIAVTPLAACAAAERCSTQGAAFAELGGCALRLVGVAHEKSKFTSSQAGAALAARASADSRGELAPGAARHEKQFSLVEPADRRLAAALTQHFVATGARFAQSSFRPVEEPEEPSNPG